jgi:hypothetical protein
MAGTCIVLAGHLAGAAEPAGRADHVGSLLQRLHEPTWATDLPACQPAPLRRSPQPASRCARRGRARIFPGRGGCWRRLRRRCPCARWETSCRPAAARRCGHLAHPVPPALPSARCLCPQRSILGSTAWPAWRSANAATARNDNRTRLPRCQALTSREDSVWSRALPLCSSRKLTVLTR